MKKFAFAETAPAPKVPEPAALELAALGADEGPVGEDRQAA